MDDLKRNQKLLEKQTRELTLIKQIFGRPLTEEIADSALGSDVSAEVRGLFAIRNQ